jgi:hypothetical protein
MTENAKELVAFLESDEYLYEQCLLRNCERMRKKQEKGVFDREKALTGWYSVAMWGAKEYVRRMGPLGIKYYEIFSVEDRKQAALCMQERLDRGEYSEKS